MAKKEIEKFELGAMIGFVAPCTKTDGTALTPASAKLYLKFKKAGVVTSKSYDMTLAGNVASYDWDSKADDPDVGTVGYYIETAGPIVANGSGQFEIVAGLANPNA
jgi:hypothetical protein